MVEFVKHLKILQLHMWKCGLCTRFGSVYVPELQQSAWWRTVHPMLFLFFWNRLEISFLWLCVLFYLWDLPLHFNRASNTSLLCTVHCKMATQSYLIITVSKSQCMTKCDLWSNCKCCKAQAKYGEEYVPPLSMPSQLTSSHSIRAGCYAGKLAQLKTRQFSDDDYFGFLTCME